MLRWQNQLEWASKKTLKRVVGKGTWKVIGLGLRCLTWGKGLILEEGKGKDRSRLPRGILDRLWGRREAKALLLQVEKPRHQR